MRRQRILSHLKKAGLRILLMASPLAAAAQTAPQPGLTERMKSNISKLKLDLRGGKPMDSPEAIIGGILNGIFSFLIIIFMVLIVYGGYTWMTAGGNESKVEKAKKILWSASYGVGIVFTSYLISVFIITIIRSA